VTCCDTDIDQQTAVWNKSNLHRSSSLILLMLVYEVWTVPLQYKRLNHKFHSSRQKERTDHNLNVWKEGMEMKEMSKTKRI